MLLKQELVKKIKNYFDLNIYETKVWLALLTKGIASAGEIEEISGVPRLRNYKFNLFQQMFTRLKNSKVKISIALSGDPQLIDKLSKSFGIKIKQINLPGKFFIADRREILFYVSKDKDDDMAIWLNSEFFADSFAELFDKAYRA